MAESGLGLSQLGRRPGEHAWLISHDHHLFGAGDDGRFIGPMMEIDDYIASLRLGR